jgi:hypothetical protein
MNLIENWQLQLWTAARIAALDSERSDTFFKPKLRVAQQSKAFG